MNFKFCWIFLSFYGRSKDLDADVKRKEHDRLLAESLALEAIRDELKKKEEEKVKRKQNGLLTKQFDG